VLLDHEPAGVVTSGTQTPYLKKAIGFAYVPSIHSSVGTVLEIEIRGKLARAQVVETPFYKRSGS
jgi:aminomethyltransferase